MQVSRACGAEVFSCTRTPLVSPRQQSKKTRKALSFAFVSAAPPFLVRLPALRVAVPEPHPVLKTHGLRSDQGA
jgi:hypothetical protein